MEDINEYLKNIKKNNHNLNRTFYDKYADFNYENKDVFKIDIDFLCSYIYDIKFIEDRDIRIGQVEFRKGLIERYKNCMITGRSNLICEACHIVPHCEDENYDLDNGLLLCRDLHRLFDMKTNDLRILFETSQVELSDRVLNDDSFKDYHQYHLKKININDNVKKYLKQRYDKYF
jgi:hypothetical protein